MRQMAATVCIDLLGDLQGIYVGSFAISLLADVHHVDVLNYLYWTNWKIITNK